MRRSLLPYLVCPRCQRKLMLRSSAAETAGQITSGTLVCPRAHVWPIAGGIPRFVRRTTRQKVRTGGRFQDQWLHLSTFTLRDKDQLLDWLAPVKSSFFKNKVVLDAGCGSGRHLLVAAAFHPRLLIGVDISQAVNLAYAKTNHHPRIHVVQADIDRLPFRQPFDFIYSVGVLHHLPHPKAGFAALVTHLRPGGSLAAWVYSREGTALIRFFSPLRIKLTSHLPLPLLSGICLLPAFIVFFLAKITRLLPKKFQRRLPLGFYFNWLAPLSFRSIHLIVYDHFTAPTAFYLSRRDVEDFQEGLNLKSFFVTPRLATGWRILTVRR
jgi:SAM-dependent methyltransferase